MSLEMNSVWFVFQFLNLIVHYYFTLYKQVNETTAKIDVYLMWLF